MDNNKFVWRGYFANKNTLHLYDGYNKKYSISVEKNITSYQEAKEFVEKTVSELANPLG